MARKLHEDPCSGPHVWRDLESVPNLFVASSVKQGNSTDLRVVRTERQDEGKTPAMLPDHHQHCPAAKACEGHAGHMAATSYGRLFDLVSVYCKLENWYKSVKIPASEYSSFRGLYL